MEEGGGEHDKTRVVVVLPGLSKHPKLVFIKNFILPPIQGFLINTIWKLEYNFLYMLVLLCRIYNISYRTTCTSFNVIELSNPFWDSTQIESAV